MQRRDASPCATCNRLVSGRDGDAKVYVGHEQIVLCRACFQEHPKRLDWLTPPYADARARRMLRDRDIEGPRGSRH